ncbi:hypothetical protein KJ784_03120 [Patescibacteria group bacterium]|nr:hypothetical protein [Patescibacteria group bacterium]
MQSTQIKINKSSANSNEGAKPAKNFVNLTNPPAKPPVHSRLKKYLWLLLILVLAEGATIAWLYFLKPVSPYQKLLPPNAIASSYFNQSTLIAFLKSQKNDNPDWPWLTWGKEALNEFRSQTKIDQPEQTLALLADQMALAILPQTTGANPTWLILATIKASSDEFLSSRDQTEQALKQNFNLTSEIYRQIKISQVQSLKKDKLSLFYAQVNNYFILTNNESLLKETIEKIIK